MGMMIDRKGFVMMESGEIFNVGRSVERVGAVGPIHTSGKVPLEKTINKQVLPQAPSPTMTSFRRISAMVSGVVFGGRGRWRRCCGWVKKLLRGWS
jgi:hypothetical protein